MASSAPINGLTGSPAPRSRVGVWFLCAGQNDNLAQGGFAMLNPYASADDLKYNPIYRNWEELFIKFIDPRRQWCAAGDAYSVIVDLERPVGILGDGRRFFNIADKDRAKRLGQSWMYDGLAEQIEKYVTGGNEVVVHQGRFNSDQWANELLKDKRPADMYEVLRVGMEAHGDFIRVGARIGMDNLSEAARSELDYKWAELLVELGVKVQVEATPTIKQTQFKGWTCRIIHRLFNENHVNQSEANAKLYPHYLSPEFAKWYPGLRVSLEWNSFGGDVTKPDWIQGQAAGVRKLLTDCPNVTALLTPKHIDEAIKAKLGPKDFLP